MPMMTTRRGAFAPSAAVVWLAVVRQNIDETSNDNRNFLMVGASTLDTKPYVDRLDRAGSSRRRWSNAGCSQGATRSRQRGPAKTSSPKESVYLKSSFSIIHGARRQQPERSYWMKYCSSITSSRTLERA